MKKRTMMVMLASFISCNAMAVTIVSIVTVNNSDMAVMQKLSGKFEEANPDIKLKWSILDENTLRQRLTVDIATKGGQYDVMTIGLFEAPLWAERGWTTPLKDFPADYDLNDILPSIREALSYKGQIYSLPFYSEATMTYYRKDLFEKAGLKMPDAPTYDQLSKLAAKLNDPGHGIYGMCLRGKPGDDTVGYVTAVANSYGGEWFNMKWQPQLNSKAWKDALTMYTGLLQNYGPPGAASNGFNENLALFASGKCAMWADATVAASYLNDPNKSVVAGKVGYARAPYGKFEKGNGPNWIWSLAIPNSSKSREAAEKFITWVTSKDYIKLVAATNGEANVPPGTRLSTYENPAYIKAAPFAQPTLEAIKAVSINDPTQGKVPYIGVGSVNIPEWPAINAAFAQDIAAVIAKKMTSEQALANAQAFAEKTVKNAGYLKE